MPRYWPPRERSDYLVVLWRNVYRYTPLAGKIRWRAWYATTRIEYPRRAAWKVRTINIPIRRHVMMLVWCGESGKYSPPGWKQCLWPILTSTHHIDPLILGVKGMLTPKGGGSSIRRPCSGDSKPEPLGEVRVSGINLGGVGAKH